MGCIQSGRAEHPPKRENVGLDSAQTTFSFRFWSQPRADGSKDKTTYFNLGRTHWLIQELWPQPVTTTHSAWRDWGRDGQHSDQHQNEGVEAGVKRREMMVGKLHPSQRWSERGRALGRGGRPGMWGAAPAPQL
ncbi:unnamed protein product [Rangifer tarandus platyrhynchus]|uniref:Uncharacterized protein n=1 Tax=Rangifer tarandus platyrhynchus TaxID=3082113 RepID=A0AC59YWZ3_RANTA